MVTNGDMADLFFQNNIQNRHSRQRRRLHGLEARLGRLVLLRVVAAPGGAQHAGRPVAPPPGITGDALEQWPARLAAIAPNRPWYRHNDSVVKRIAACDVFGVESQKTAYILVYTLRD
jgi:hypothetical protein